MGCFEPIVLAGEPSDVGTPASAYAARDLDLGLVQWGALALLPVAAALIGMETARRTVLGALAEMA